MAATLHRHLIFLGLAIVPLNAGFAANPYQPPPTHRADVLLDAPWRFMRQDVAGAERSGFDDSNWAKVSLPHTWNNLDGQDGGDNYYRGIGWYRTHFKLSGKLAGRRFFLKFDGAFSVADVWVNGQYLGRHQGGFAAFAFDATPFVKAGADNLVAVKVNNAYNPDIPPLSADFTFFGGLYRDVHLLVTDPVQISPLDYASPGIYLKTSEVSSNSANLQITALVSNALSKARAVTVRTVITDAATNVVASLTNVTTLPPASITRVLANTSISGPHLWDGIADPYLYRVFVEVRDRAQILDVVEQPLGIRWFSVDPEKGFFLNGHYYDLRGVSLHQDWLDCGWALNEIQRQTNFQLLKEMGATMVRLSHYQHAERVYQLADQNGIALWTEIPLINNITESPAFADNAKQQLIELIRQNCNHPSVICWGVFNEITLHKGPSVNNLIVQLADVAAQEDSTRPSTCAVAGGDDQPSNWDTKIMSFNRYFGWYVGQTGDFARWADKVHAAYPARCIGVSEFGAGASIRQHAEDPVTEPVPASGFHPEEYQNLFHETYWQAMKERPFLWCKLIWNMADFAIDQRREGDTPGRNDKGLVTYDRQTRKDAFYWYQANWTTKPMVYITGHTFANRLTNSITAKVYANCDSVELLLNGQSQGARTSTNCIFAWPITLAGGTNRVEAVGKSGASEVRDALTWMAPPVHSHQPDTTD